MMTMATEDTTHGRKNNRIKHDPKQLKLDELYVLYSPDEGKDNAIARFFERFGYQPKLLWYDKMGILCGPVLLDDNGIPVVK